MFLNCSTGSSANQDAKAEIMSDDALRNTPDHTPPVLQHWVCYCGISIQMHLS